ncbi:MULTISPECIES: hypothetical protein [unclassified Pseudomonas]|uniref:hypothetical protein n=1 Tax=unclassified Pseudomonas TaxID=196821 RepID=UPI001F5945F9|nr:MULTISPECIES: hypothetical protein [unclassified Pseudomonas]
MAEETQHRRDALVQLAQDNQTRSYTAQIRELYEAIETALNSGVKRTVIHQKLVESGMSISLRHFDQALYRIRKNQKQGRVSRKHMPLKANNNSPSKPVLKRNDEIKPQANFRQNLNQIREDVENTDWARVISDANNPAQS